MIGDLIAGAIPMLRAQAESMMTDSCTITRVVGEPTIDPTTNRLVPTTAEVYSGPCRIRFEMNRVQPREVEGQLLVARQSMLFLPYAGTAGIRVDDTVLIASEGTTVRIAGGFSQTYATARRFPVEAVS